MKNAWYFLIVFILLYSLPVQALDPVAPRAERRFGIVYVKTPNPGDKVVLVNQRAGGDDIEVTPGQDVQIRVGDFRVTVKIAKEYEYIQDVTVRPTERHEIIVPGYGNLRVNGVCDEVLILKGKKEIDKIKCNQIRTLPRGVYDLKIKKGKFTLDQSASVVTNTLREFEVR